MDLDEIYLDAEERMEKSVEHVKSELAKIRTGRATPSLLDGVRVDYYGALTPLNQVATVSAPEARLLKVTPFDKSSIADVEKAILSADLGLNPSNDGSVIRIPIPELSDERRKDLLRLAKKYGEEGRVAVRNVRRDANDKSKALEKSKEISEDQMHDANDEIQNYTNKYIKQIDEILEKKEKDLLGD